MAAKSQVAGSVVAGFPSPAEQYLEPPLDLNELLVKRPAATFFVKVEGDSMINAGIQDKDLLVVDRALTPANGDIIICRRTRCGAWGGVCRRNFAPSASLPPRTYGTHRTTSCAQWAA